MSLPNISDACRTEAFEQYTAQVKLVNDHAWRCCANCLKVTNDVICSENGLTIPVRVAVVGCGKWDNLPF